MVQIDPPSPYEPRVPPYSHPPYLRIIDKARIDEEYMSFTVVWQRLWPAYLQERLQGFCDARESPHIFHKELLYDEVDKLLHRWIAAAVPTRAVWNYHHVRNGLLPPEAAFVARPGWEEEWRARIDYERLVRLWHVEEHGMKYQLRAAGELRKMGEFISRMA
ncbi:MAG: hypothetical protein Q9211_000951 [Gyalolechia sp. 1 TL-2023]